jgi:hypothetical protein
MNTKAIYALYPQVVKTVEAEAFDGQGNKVEIDLDAVNSWVDPNAYKAKRLAEYPPIGDQLDALWKGGDAAAKMLAIVQAVKAKYPKETP